MSRITYMAFPEETLAEWFDNYKKFGMCKPQMGVTYTPYRHATLTEWFLLGKQYNRFGRWPG